MYRICFKYAYDILYIICIVYNNVKNIDNICSIFVYLIYILKCMFSDILYIYIYIYLFQSIHLFFPYVPFRVQHLRSDFQGSWGY